MKIKFFAQLQTFTGCNEVELSSEHAMSPEELWDMLESRFPGIIRHKNFTRLACNFVYANSGELFKDEDEIALIPPVSGG